MIRILPLFLILLSVPCLANRVAGERKQWHTVTVSFDGPQTAEDASPNPFLDMRLIVEFRHQESGRALQVPGFFAADGEAAESSAAAGRVWQARLLPDAPGDWTYRASFRTGANIALSDDPSAGQPTAFDGATGRFTISASDKSAPDFRARGLLQYTGEHYLRFSGTGERFLKGGADSPENFLAYFEFDGTFDTDATFNEGQNTTAKPFVHRYQPHAGDWKPGDPTWQNGKGRNIIGALNYLAGTGMNSVYFLTYNVDTGDGKDTWVWTSPDVRDRFDVSKLAQWEIVFSHMDRLGLMLHVITQETENDRKLGGGPGLNPIRRLYLRELVARFAHHPALVWNLGEENNTPDADRKQIAAYIHALDPYRHPIAVHSHVNRAHDDYQALWGDAGFEASSVQADMARYHQEAVAFRARSAEAGRKWVIFHDEQSSAHTGVLPDADDPTHDIPRIEGLWGNLMGGGAGVEWYFGYRYPHMDLNCEDWRSRDAMWRQTRIALHFFHQHLPFWEMEPVADERHIVDGAPARVLAKAGSIYALQLPRGGSVQIQLPEGAYTVQWFNPRDGGPLQEGPVKQVTGGRQRVWLGEPPAETSRDWVVLVKRR
ncbi:MAG: DUF5060 domain-containing protein [Bryobacterales bacterium]|nr:DUF5060 domain-containing protein [Bryobacterales bacterium]